MERVLELWEQVADAQEVLGIDHLALLEETLAAAYSAGDYHRALSLTRVGLDEVDEDAEPSRAARLLERRGKLLGHVGKSDGLAELRRAYELAVRQIDDPGRAGLLANVAYHIGRLDGWRARSSPSRRGGLPSEVGDREAEMSAALTLGRVCSPDLAAEDGLPQLRRVAAVARERNDLLSLVKAQVNISDALFEMGEYAESAQVAEAGAALALKIGVSRSTGAYLRSNLAEALVALGRWDDADAVCVAAARFDPPGELGLLWLEIRAALRLARGHPGATDLVNRALGYLARPYTDPQVRLPLHACASTRRWPPVSPTMAWPRRSPGWPTRSWTPTRGSAWPIVVAASRLTDPAVRSAVASLAARLETRYPAEVAGAAEVAARLATGPAELPLWEAAVAARRTDGRPYPLARALVGPRHGGGRGRRPGGCGGGVGGGRRDRGRPGRPAAARGGGDAGPPGRRARRGGRRPRRADRAGARGPAAGRAGAQQQPDRRGALPVAEDGERARVADHREARGGEPHRGGCRGPPPEPPVRRRLTAALARAL